MPLAGVQDIPSVRVCVPACVGLHVAILLVRRMCATASSAHAAAGHLLGCMPAGGRTEIRLVLVTMVHRARTVGKRLGPCECDLYGTS